MGRFIYTAVRELEETGVSVVGADISASSIDNGFHSTTTDLSQFTAGRGIYVTGGLNAGWHSIVSNTPTQILTSSSLVTESAGPSIAIRESFRVYGTQYEFEVPVTSTNYPVELSKRPNRTIGGRYRTAIFGYSKMVDFSIDGVNEQYWGQLFEFLMSISGGESFSYDEYGSIAAPLAPITLKNIGDNLPKNRVGTDPYFGTTFRAVIL